MLSNNKNILFLFDGPIFNPNSENFSRRFSYFSDYFKGSILASVGSNQGNYECKLGAFSFFGFPIDKSSLSGRYKLASRIFKKAMELNCENKIDLIVCYDPLFMGPIGGILKFFLNTKLVVGVTTDGSMKVVKMFSKNKIIYFIKYFYHNLNQWFSFLCADKISILTLDALNYITKKFHKKIFVLPAGISSDYFLLEQNSFDKRVLFVGSPFYLKGVDILIGAFLKKYSEFLDFQLHLVGYCLEDDARIFFTEFPKNIVFIKPMSYEKLRSHFLSCYCLVLPSRTEGMGRVLLEAMASGKPVIGSNVGGIPSLIEDGRNGFLFESENVDDLAEKLDRLLSDPELAKRMGEESRRIVEEKFSSEKYVENFRKMVDEILQSN